MAELVKDTNNRYFIVTDDVLTDEPSMQNANGTRIPITGTGQLEAARELYGEERTNVDLTGYYESPQAAVDYFGGPGEMERVVAGEATDPITGEVPNRRTGSEVGGDEQEVPDDPVRTSPPGYTTPPGDPTDIPPQNDRDQREQRAEEERSAQQEYFDNLLEMEEERRREEREQAEQNARAILQSYLDQWGLGDLSDNVWDSVKGGASRPEIVQEIRDTEEYANRFPGIQQQKQNNFPVMNESEYLEAETSIRSIMRSAGMPRGFYDDRDQIGSLIGQHISPREVSQRVKDGWRQVITAPEEVKQEFRSHLGIHGEQGLAAYFIDPDRASEVLQDEVERAFIGGTASRFDFDLDDDRIDELQSLGINREAARRGFAEVAKQRRSNIFRETVGERNQDLRADEEGVAAAFEQDPDAAERIERRTEQRTAAFSGVGSRPQVTQRGTGMGAAGSRSRLRGGFGGFGG